MIHGFPDYWYSWRDQMNVLKDRFTVVAIDQRGYNKSDQPEVLPIPYQISSPMLLQLSVRKVQKGNHRRTRLGRCGSLAIALRFRKWWKILSF